VPRVAGGRRVSPTSRDGIEAGSTSSTTLPLVAASQRLRRAPGRRPRKTPETGDVPGTSTAATRANPGPTDSPPGLRTIAPRLLGLDAAAVYLGLSTWSVRDLETTGTLRPVRIPTAGQGELRKLLFDRADLDRLIETWKHSA
jgi:hypothetical protein